MARHTEGPADAGDDDTLALPTQRQTLSNPVESSANAEIRLTLAEEELLIHKRRVPTGAIDIHKRVETEHVRRAVPVTREDATIERVPAPPGMGTETVIEGDETRIPIVEEELVVTKRLVVREMIVIRKRRLQEEQIVEADLRSEWVDVHTEGEVREAEDNPR